MIKNNLLLADRNINITSRIAQIFKVFEDLTFVARLREEMDKVRPAFAIPSWIQPNAMILTYIRYGYILTSWTTSKNLLLQQFFIFY